MVSTIRIGPENGPYVKVEENNGSLDIITPNDTVDLQSNELVNAALGGIMNAKGNDITNVNQLDANSVNAASAAVGGNDLPELIEAIDTTGTVSRTIDTSEFNGQGDNVIVRIISAEDTAVDLIVNGNTTTSYTYTQLGFGSRTGVSSDTKFALIEGVGSNNASGGSWTLFAESDAVGIYGNGVVHPDWSSATDNILAQGGIAGPTSINSISIETVGGSDPYLRADILGQH